ncbi:LytTR family DNA-binding domain-containing protein [Allomuricauda sp.]|uniref:LytR/AlgR family response regulator transcription factor n=1 Tax=Flagellimonas alginolytica TaxID=3177515 RepID=UPI0025D08560|nr:LytTR family DNA-binding domain-containing protein [Allomuricauda sp.]
MIKAIIVDDEFNAIKNLKWEIERFCADVKILDTFTDPLEAISAINYLKPDCVFLDIEMPEMDGFEMLNTLKYRSFDLVITSAYDNYAIKAFRQHAIDYLLKPVDSDDLIEVIERIRANKQKNVLGSELKDLFEEWREEGEKRLALPMSGKTLYVDRDDILYCKSDGNYTEVYFVNGKKEVLSKRLKDLEDMLAHGFFRVHNSYLIRLNAIKEFVNQDGQYLVLCDGTNVPVSRSKKHKLMQALNG